MSSKKVLITADVHPYLADRFRELGFVVDIREDIARKALLDCISEYAVLIITTYLKADRELIDRAENLKIIGRVGSGMENIDQPYCKEKKILCFNSPEGNANAVGEHTLGLLLSVLNNINISNAELRQGIWQREANRGVELSGKTVGIIGFGHTGSAFARILACFDVKILAYDPYQTITSGEVTQTSLQFLQENSEVISFHVPYTPETHHYINPRFIKSCTKNPVLLNTSRGAVADTLALIDALENKSVAGYGVDVYEDEPITKAQIHPFSLYQQLLSFKQVVGTPHIAGWTQESRYKLARILMDKMEHFLTF